MQMQQVWSWLEFTQAVRGREIRNIVPLNHSHWWDGTVMMDCEFWLRGEIDQDKPLPCSMASMSKVILSSKTMWERVVHSLWNFYKSQQQQISGVNTSNETKYYVKNLSALPPFRLVIATISRHWKGSKLLPPLVVCLSRLGCSLPHHNCLS